MKAAVSLRFFVIGGFMKRLLAIVLLVCTTVLSLTGCGLFDYITSVYSNVTGYKSYAKGRRHYDLNAKVQSDKKVFDINDVTLDFYYSLYCLDNYISIEEVKSSFYLEVPEEDENYNWYSWQYVHAIFIGESDDTWGEKYGFYSSFDEYLSSRSAKLYKFIDFEEAFVNDYGCTISQKGFSKVTHYNHKETLTIPAEMFSESSGEICIYLVRISHKLSTDEYLFTSGNQATVKIEYKLLENNKVRFN